MAVQQIPGLRRTDLQRHDLGVPGREVIQNRVDVDPDAPAFRAVANVILEAVAAIAPVPVGV